MYTEAPSGLIRMHEYITLGEAFRVANQLEHTPNPQATGWRLHLFSGLSDQTSPSASLSKKLPGPMINTVRWIQQELGNWNDIGFSVHVWFSEVPAPSQHIGP